MQKADIVVIGDAMFRGASRNETPSGGGIAIVGDTIAAVGEEAELRDWIGPETKVYRYGKDKLLMPGFCDSHLHLSLTIAAENGPQLRFVESEEACVAKTKEWAEKHPDAPWVVGQGWHHSNWPSKQPPDKKQLSAAIPDRPVCLADVDCHAYWLNQAALDLVGITAETPNAPGGVIHRDRQGEPTGYIEENPGLDILFAACDAVDTDAAIREKRLENTIAAFNRRGITSVMDALDTPDIWVDTCLGLAESGRFSLRLFLTVLFNDCDGYMEAGKALKKRLEDYSLLNFWGFKGLTDGVAGAHTAWMTDDYADAPGERGYPIVDPETYRQRLLDIEKSGYGVHLHACGTRAVEYCLDMLEEAKARGYIKGQRNTITHCDTVNDKDFARFGELGVIASLQPDMLTPTHSYADNLYPLRFGETLFANGWANRRLFDNAPVVSLSSDSPVTIANPMYNIYRATQRIGDDGLPAGGIHPEQKVSLSECLWAYTYGGAYQLACEDRLGTLEVGKLADIAVLDHNIFTAPPDAYREIQSALTIVNGKVVFEKE